MKREFGIKARHMSQLEDDRSSRLRQIEKEKYAFAVISDKPGRVISFLEPLLAKHGKFFEFHGFDLYRHAIEFTHLPTARRTVALVLTDGPEDRLQGSENGLERWKETIVTFSETYLEQFTDEISEDHLPATFTIVLLFHEKYGKLSEEELQKMEEEFLQFHEGRNFAVRSCHSEEDVVGTIEEEVIQRVLKRHTLTKIIKAAGKSRNRQIAKATKATREAFVRTRADTPDS